jgi:hypothetical protein
MKSIILKLSPKFSTEPENFILLEKIKQKLVLNQISDLSEFNHDLQFELISESGDHSNYKHESPNCYIPKIFEKNNIFDLVNYSVFKYIGNSRIDGNPMFVLDFSGHRNKIIEDLGIL